MTFVMNRSVILLVSFIGVCAFVEIHFNPCIGLDIVPIQPDLRSAGAPDLESRITWVQHNL